ncbi:MAG: DUF72 domain-containing protein [Betaproteobacteria bacterium]|nr:MAG: DUF72 domain-containing protein [Betaproteobacteria bacterium]
MASIEQFDLFGNPIEITHVASKREPSSRLKSNASGSAKVAAAEADDELRRTAQSLPCDAFFGSSSWSFPGWSGIVYDAPHSDSQLARHGLPAYAAHPLLRAVGIDRTFYSPISEADFRGYAKQVEAINPRFRFLVKAPMMITGPRLRSDDGRWSDNPAFLDAGLAAAQFVLPATAGLGIHCGALVFQFPPLGPRLTRSPEQFANALAEFLLALPKLSGDAYYAVEMRDPEVLTDDYLAALCAGGATHCLAIHSRMPQARDQARFWRESGRLPLTVRWSLHSGFKYEEAKERYAPFNALVDEDPEGRSQIAALVREAEALGLPSMVIVNNKAEGSAPLTIRKLSELIAEHGETVIKRHQVQS